ncbi:MAG TPA: PIN domain-containing protein [Spirochaetota bacterium]|nr:PIN domain-containing protein [Spirochaetota bacterium]HPF07807.1 PIN domain-containing protein [Spirochaetota bacterium]HPJ44399.1 PIN domain-containing protein [Spirochaetota bacterium]HRX49193.1 PIN domain-containing protein [Spirochaetota bacterium]
MKDRIFLDTNVLVYALDNEDVAKQEKAKSILNEFYNNDNYFLSTQVVQEFCNVVLKKIEPDVPEGELAEFISSFPLEQVRMVDINAITKALSLKARYRYSFWDSLIIAAAIHADCGILYTEDLKHQQMVDSLKIINPFM